MTPHFACADFCFNIYAFHVGFLALDIVQLPSMNARKYEGVIWHLLIGLGRWIDR